MTRRIVAFALLTAMVLGLSAGSAAQTVRRGAWLDEIVVVEEPSSPAALTRIEAGDINAFFWGMAAADLYRYRRIVESPAMSYVESVGSFDELTFNPHGPTFRDGRLNPFAVPRIREAMNWLVDRDYIVKELYGGLAVPRYTMVHTAAADYARLADIIRVIDRKYAPNATLAQQVITEEMRKLGAELVGGKWQYKGKPVTLIFAIRIEDVRKQVGDYVSGLLEGIGFTVERRYGTSAELSPLWYSGDPADGKFHIYTGGWIRGAINRDEGGNFDFFYTPRSTMVVPLWQAYKPDPEFDAVALRLSKREFSSMEERRELFAKALELSLKDSVRIWLVDRKSIWATQKGVQAAADLCGGLSGSLLWPYTIRYTDRVGGSMRIASTSMLTMPWNPVGGSNWIFDMTLIRATSDFDLLPDPYTGLFWPQRLARAEVYAKQGLPIARSLDWVTLNFVETNKVPADAWVDWDAKAQRFITAGEKFPEGRESLIKTVLRYPADLFQTKWHDGSNFSLGDMVLRIIMLFDRSKPESAIYDSASVPGFNSFMGHFRGVKIVSRNPLVIEWYTDRYYPDVEWVAADGSAFVWPYYAQGIGPWHTLALSILAEADKKIAFTAARATALKVEHTSLIAGPSLTVLRNMLPGAARDKILPYEPTMSQFVPREESWARWNNLVRWFAQRGHFWVGNGPYYLEKVFPVEKVVHLKRFADFPDPAGKWDRFGVAARPSGTITGPARITIGQAATFDVRITTGGKPYPVKDMQEVSFLLFDAKGELALTGPITAVSDGLWRLTLTAAQTGRLPAGTTTLEVVMVSKLVAVPSFVSLDIVTRR